MNEITDNNQIQKDRILASLYFILTNNYNWNLFLEITGESEFDKSIFINLAQLLTGKQNLIEVSQLNLNHGKVLNGIVNKSLIISYARGVEYHNEKIISKIVQPQNLMINYKKHKFLSYKPKSIYLVSSRRPLFLSKSYNLINQRVILWFDRKLPKNLQSTALEIELISEIEGIVQQILFRFKNCPGEAKDLLIKQKNNIKALLIKNQQKKLNAVTEYKQHHFTEEEEQQLNQLKIIRKYERILAKDNMTIDELFSIMKCRL